MFFYVGQENGKPLKAAADAAYLPCRIGILTPFDAPIPPLLLEH
jgi:hypothetical protein